MKMKKILLLLLAGLLLGCNANNKINEITDELCSFDDIPHGEVFLQPYNDFSQGEAVQLKDTLQVKLNEILHGDFQVKVLPNKTLPKEYLSENNRYRTDRIIQSLSQEANSHKIIVGITHRDICVPEYKNKKNWGVLGCALPPKYKSCIVSDYRLKNKKRDFWRVVVHEFIHTYFEYHHCPKDNPRCIMKDAKGHADFSNKNDLCDTCRNQLI